MSTLVLAEIPVQKAAEICVQSPDTVGYMDVVVVITLFQVRLSKVSRGYISFANG